MTKQKNLTPDEMYEALLQQNSEYEGIFFVGVKTTGIFCRPTCSARKPKFENVQFFERRSEAVASGFRPCKRCRPMSAPGSYPLWLQKLMHECEKTPQKRWPDKEILALGINPKRVRRWFLTNHGLTFQAFLRARRLTFALSEISLGRDSLQVAFDCGYQSLSGFREAFQNWLGCQVGVAAASSEFGESVIYLNRVMTPLGPMIVGADQNHLLLLEFTDRKNIEAQFKRLQKYRSQQIVPGNNHLIEDTKQQLEQYFQGTRKQFDLPLQFAGTKFQNAVWNELLKVEFGTTVSYEEIAKRIGAANAQRAIGKSNGDNCLAIVVPCHRVVRADGKLSGYGGGVRRKEWLIQHEKDAIQNRLDDFDSKTQSNYAVTTGEPVT